METVWILGDQLTAASPALTGREPGTFRVLMIESRAKLASRRWHRQRAHLYVASMRRFAAELRALGHDVDYQLADTFAAGLRAHGADHVTAAQPRSWTARERLTEWGVALVDHDAYLCHERQFATWAEGRRNLVMEDFYRWQRRRLGYLMDGEQPVGGRWNLDADNREPPPKDGRAWPEPPAIELDDLDEEVLHDLEGYDLVGASPADVAASMRWPTSAAQPSNGCDGSSPRVWRPSERTRTPCWVRSGSWPTRCSRHR